jgi:hypothetical protein
MESYLITGFSGLGSSRQSLICPSELEAVARTGIVASGLSSSSSAVPSLTRKNTASNQSVQGNPDPDLLSDQVPDTNQNKKLKTLQENLFTAIPVAFHLTIKKN